MTLLTGYDATNFPLDILYDAGVVFIGADAIGVTSGAPKFTPGKSYEQIAFDGKHAPVEGLDRVKHGGSTLTFTMKEIGNAASGGQITILDAGATSATDGGSPPVTTVTPKSSGLIATGYQSDVRVLWERGASGSGNYFAVHFAKALVTKFDISGTASGEGMVSVEISGRVPSGSPLNAPDYAFEYRTNLPS